VSFSNFVAVPEKGPDFEAAVVFKTISRGRVGNRCCATWIAQSFDRKPRRVEWPAKMSIVVMDPFNELFGQRRSDPDSVQTDNCSSSGRVNAPQHEQSVIYRRESEAQFNGEGSSEFC
jgi:hypothetical protein